MSAALVNFCYLLCITRSSGKAPVAKRDYNSTVSLKGWLYRQVNTATFIQLLKLLCMSVCVLYMIVSDNLN